jgi:formylglycine-generating enzyme required for sulfatase activity/nucleoid-associated protein YgaU
MNEFDSSIRQAKKTHALRNAIAGGVVLIVTIGLILWLAVIEAFTVNVQPENARASATFSIVGGIGYVSGNTIYKVSPQVEIIASADKFIAASVLIDSKSTSVINIVLQPVPGELKGIVIGEHTDTAWILDGELKQLGAEYSESLKPGRYELTVDSPHHQVDVVDANVESDKVFLWEPQLTLIQGRLSIQSTPTNASVFIDGQEVGKTPWSKDMIAKQYAVRVEQAGFEPTVEDIDITRQRPDPTRRYNLKPLSAALSLTLEPAGGSLLVDDKVVSDSRRIPLASNKQHIVSYQKPGYFTVTKTYNVTAGQTLSDAISLKEEVGEVAISSNLQANISINGKSVGTTPFNQTMRAIEYKVVLSKPGYRSVERTIKPSSEAKVALDVELLTEYQARRKEGKPSVAQIMGIQFLQVKPTAFSMGSKDNEQGRRRNEFVKQVDFTRPIYVSRHEITEAQFARFKGSSSTSNLPATDMSWYDAIRFCNWLSEQEGLPPFYRVQNGRYLGFDSSSNGFRLPSEAEWEWLARKGRRSTETTFVWGDVRKPPEDAGNFGDESIKSETALYLKDYDDGHAGKAPVGSFDADRLGLFDLAGNVSEWVHDAYTNQPPTQTTGLIDDFGSTRGEGNVFKGGHFQIGQVQDLRAAYREPATSPLPTLGFRIVRYE